VNPGRLFSLPILRLNDLRQLWEEEAIYEALDGQEDEGSSAFLWMLVGVAVAISIRAALMRQGVQV
jgi:hypothetical protein